MRYVKPRLVRTTHHALSRVEVTELSTNKLSV